MLQCLEKKLGFCSNSPYEVAIFKSIRRAIEFKADMISDCLDLGGPSHDNIFEICYTTCNLLFYSIIHLKFK